MKEITLKNFNNAKIYIEDLEYYHHIPAGREEEDRIKVFDSFERYMDYWDMELLKEAAEANEHSLEEEYQSIIKHYEDATKLDQIVESNAIEFQTEDVFEMARELEIPVSRTSLEHEIEYEVLQNEWVNKVGKWWILTSEY